MSLESGIMSEIARGFDKRRPAWSPDGDQLVFSSNREGVFNLYLQPADGSSSPQRITTSEHTQYPGSWSADGQWIAFAEDRPETGLDLWILSLSDGAVEPFVQSDANDNDPQFSPDGGWIAYVSDETGRGENSRSLVPWCRPGVTGVQRRR
jgi:Tol biopolymer transport system component